MLEDMNPEGKSHKKRIIIVDDHPLVRAGLAALINEDQDLEVCAEAAEQGEALQLVDELCPDLAIIDISLKSGSGLELIKHIKASRPTVKTLVLSMHDESLYAERAIRAGALGYVNKQEGGQRVMEAVHKVLEGKVYLGEKVTDEIVQRMNQTEGQPFPSPFTDLSDRELEVFFLIGQGVSTKKIAERLYLSIKTIETHRDRIKKKLGLESGNELNRYAIQWVLEHPDQQT
jgi:DNA-binding NarL/FixJ family response regulator